MKRGFQLLQTKRPGDNGNIGIIEKEFGFLLPPIYKLFAEIFELGEKTIFVDNYYSPKHNEFYPCSTYFYEPEKDEILFNGFNSVESALMYRDNDDDWVTNGYIPIGNCGSNSSILLGSIGSEADKIIFHEVDAPQPFRVISNHIFEFVRNLILEPIDPDFLLDEVKFSMLYKNWGEDFWRVRETA